MIPTRSAPIHTVVAPLNPTLAVDCGPLPISPPRTQRYVTHCPLLRWIVVAVVTFPFAVHWRCYPTLDVVVVGAAVDHVWDAHVWTTRLLICRYCPGFTCNAFPVTRYGSGHRPTFGAVGSRFPLLHALLRVVAICYGHVA